ncbi:MAG: hypothetical protein ACC630_01630 [Nitrospinota bacterium]
MSSFAIEKIKIPVTLHMSDRSIINGNIFLSKISPLHQGRELSKDMLNSVESFFPIELEDNSIIFINKYNVAKVTSLEEKEIIDEEEKKEKVRMQVTLSIIDSSLIGGNIFLSQYSPIHHGREMAKDMFNSGEDFFPIEIKEDNSIIMVNKSNVTKVILAERDLLEDELTMGKQQSAKITLSNGEIITGMFVVEMPEEKSRLSDFLNTTYKYFYIKKEDDKDNDLIINSNSVNTITPA